MKNMIEVSRIGAELDFLATEDPTHLPLFHSVKPTYKSAIVSSMRNEGLLLTEWVAHYRILGFDRIIIYTNGNDDGSDQMLAALQEAGVIHWVQNLVAEGLSPQFKAFRHAFWLLDTLAMAEWAAFIDADEFIIPLVDGKIYPVNEFIEHIERNFQADAIALNWRWFGGDRSYAMDQGLVMQRYQTAVWDQHIKSIFRLRGAEKIKIHSPIYAHKTKVIDGNGEERSSKSQATGPARTELGQINHYWNRSFEEFYVKRQRGRGATRDSMRSWSDFFSWGMGTETQDHFPTEAHLAAVETEMARLRALPGYAEAEQRMYDLFRATVAFPEVRAIYEEYARKHGIAF